MIKPEQYLGGLMFVCEKHRNTVGLTVHDRLLPPTQDSCVKDRCKHNCPILKMPKALTREELNEIEINVYREHLKEMRMEELE